MKEHIPIIVIAATIIILTIIFFNSQKEPSPCEELLKTTADKLKASLTIFKQEGGIAIGEEQIQELSEPAQVVGVKYKACCILSMNGKLSPEQTLECMEVRKYENNIDSLVKMIDEFKAAKKNGDVANISLKQNEICNVIDSVQKDKKKKVIIPRVRVDDKKITKDALTSEIDTTSKTKPVPKPQPTTVKKKEPNKKPEQEIVVPSNPTEFSFYDDFSLNNKGWQESSSETSKHIIQNGRYYLTNKSVEYYLASEINLDVDFTKNFTIETEIRNTNCKEGAIGIAWGASTTGENRFVFWINTHGYYGVFEKDDGNRIEVLPSKAGYLVRQANILRIIRNGNNLYLYVNDDSLATISYIKVFGQGCGIYLGNTKCEIAATYFKVTGTKK